MKRMYVTLTIIVLVLIGAGNLLAQKISKPIDDNDSSSLEKRLQMREEMHRRMMEKILKGGPSDEMFKDMEQFLDEVMTDTFSGLDNYSRKTAQNYQMEWKETSEGRTLVVTPEGPEQKLNINVSNGLIIIQGKKETKTANGTSVSDFSNSFNVPGDCDQGKVKLDQKDGKILIQFPFRVAKKEDLEIKGKRRPVAPSGNEVQI